MSFTGIGHTGEWEAKILEFSSCIHCLRCMCKLLKRMCEGVFYVQGYGN